MCPSYDQLLKNKYPQNGRLEAACLSKWRDRTHSWKRRNERQHAASCGASELWLYWRRGQASVNICSASVLETPHCDKKHFVTSLFQSRAAICGATNLPVEKGSKLQLRRNFLAIYVSTVATNACFIYGGWNAWDLNSGRRFVFRTQS